MNSTAVAAFGEWDGLRGKKLAQYAEKRSWESPREDQAELMRALAREIMGRSKRGHK